jgi:molecular chaperone GrpE
MTKGERVPKKEKVTKEDKQQAEYTELKDLLQRTQADFVNYRRRNEEDKANFVKYATSDVIEQILPVMDNFALAAKHVPTDIENSSWVIGIKAIEKQLEQVLLVNGLTTVDAVGQQFDPKQHEALGEIADKSQNDGIIMSEEAPGYLLNGKLIRPAKVIVNKLK